MANLELQSPEPVAILKMKTIRCCIVILAVGLVAFGFGGGPEDGNLKQSMFIKTSQSNSGSYADSSLAITADFHACLRKTDCSEVITGTEGTHIEKWKKVIGE